MKEERQEANSMLPDAGRFAGYLKGVSTSLLAQSPAFL
jgi:hypothetical protein